MKQKMKKNIEKKNMMMNHKKWAHCIQLNHILILVLKYRVIKNTCCSAKQVKKK